MVIKTHKERQEYLESLINIDFSEIGDRELKSYILLKGDEILNQKTNLKTILRDIENKLILQVLYFTNGNKSLTARYLGISRQNLIDKCKELSV